MKRKLALSSNASQNVSRRQKDASSLPFVGSGLEGVVRWSGSSTQRRLDMEHARS